MNGKTSNIFETFRLLGLIFPIFVSRWRHQVQWHEDGMALQRVQLVVVGALDLPAMDGKTSDPYVKFQYKGKEYRTPTLKKTLQPKWNYTAEFAYNKVFGPHLLYLEVWDANVIRSDKFIGKTTLNLEFLEMNKTVDKWYPLEHVAKAQDSATLRVKLTLLPPLTETSPNAGEGQKVVVVAHGNAQATAAGRPGYSTSSLLNTYHPVSSVSPPPVYPVYAASSTPTAYSPPPAAPLAYCYPPAAPTPPTHPAPVAHLPAAHPPPSGHSPPFGYPPPSGHPPPSGYPPPSVYSPASAYSPPPVVPYSSPSPSYGAGSTCAYSALPPYTPPSPYAFKRPNREGKPHKKADKRKEENESSSSGSESRSRSASSEATSREKGTKSRTKPQVIKMEINLPIS